MSTDVHNYACCGKTKTIPYSPNDYRRLTGMSVRCNKCFKPMVWRSRVEVQSLNHNQDELQDMIKLGYAKNDEFTNAMANALNPSEKQKYWITKLLDDARQRKQKAESPKTAQVEFNQINELFSIAKAVLKRPCVRLMIDEEKITLTPAKENSRNPGAIYIKGETSARYFGKITAKGEVDLTYNAPIGLKTLLLEFAANPALVATKYGKLTSACSFCGLTLSDSRSVEVGYGPVCAEHWKLPWG